MVEPFALKAFLPFRLNRLAAEISERLSRIYAERFGIDIPQWRVLAPLAGKGEATAQAVVASTRTHKSTISRAVSELEARALIARAPSTEDKRSYTLVLTPEAHRLSTALEPLVLEYERSL